MEDNESIQDQLDELRTRMIELNEFAQHIPLIGEAFGLIKGMLIDLIEATDADPDDYIDDLDRLDQITHLLLASTLNVALSGPAVPLAASPSGVLRTA